MSYEKKVFNEETNVAMCKAFIENGLYDPIAKKLGVELFGKSIVICVSQNHASRITNILNKLAFIGNKKELLNGANILHFKNMFHEINYRYMVGIF